MYTCIFCFSFSGILSIYHFSYQIYFYIHFLHIWFCYFLLSIISIIVTILLFKTKIIYYFCFTVFSVISFNFKFLLSFFIISVFNLYIITRHFFSAWLLIVNYLPYLFIYKDYFDLLDYFLLKFDFCNIQFYLITYFSRITIHFYNIRWKVVEMKSKIEI